MVQEDMYVFEDSNEPKVKKSALKEAGKFLWNSETKEFCGRDGASWGKVSLFYAIFYLCLGSFFVGMLAVFVAIMPKDKPTYYGESSTMSARGVNPGLGFRPQIDVEDSLIMYSPNILSHDRYGYKKYVNNLHNFLSKKYTTQEGQTTIDCSDGQELDSASGNSCTFDYNEIYKNTNCTLDNDFGFKSHKPCILIKLNKIISWKPQGGNVEIKCEGEFSADKDNLKSITYHSPSNINSNLHAILDKKYFPFLAQKSYRAPFIWAQIDITPNTLVNIECKAYAENIDNSDRLNRRGQTKFSLYINSKPIN